jgi:hypothetical protein
LKIPGWLSAAGRRQLMALGVFGNEDKHLFEHADRVSPTAAAIENIALSGCSLQGCIPCPVSYKVINSHA